MIGGTKIQYLNIGESSERQIKEIRQIKRSKCRRLVRTDRGEVERNEREVTTEEERVRKGGEEQADKSKSRRP